MEKFKILCNNNQEFRTLQKILFKDGYHWNSSNKNDLYIMNRDKFPVAIQNFIGDNIGYNLFFDEDFLVEDNIKIINFVIFVRKYQLRKLENVR